MKRTHDIQKALTILVIIAFLTALVMAGFYLDQKYHQYQFERLEKKLRNYG